MQSQRKFQIEDLIKGLTRKRKEIEEYAGPTAVRSDKLYTELEIERLEALRDAWQSDAPLIDAPPCRRLLRSMGLINVEYGTLPKHAVDSFGECAEIAKTMGFPVDKCCDKIAIELAAVGSGAWTKPDIILGDGHACEIDHQWHARSYGDLFNIPVFFVDFALDEDDKPNLASISYVADQLGEFIEWAESKLPGVKYDEARHIELLEMDAMAQKYQPEIYSLLKHIPCPISPQEALHTKFLNAEPSFYPNMQKVVDYSRMLRDELGERVARGTGPYPEERLRLLWAGQRHGMGNLSPSKLLLKRKVALPVAARGYRRPPFSSMRDVLIGDVSRYGVKLSPLQEEAADLNRDWWGGPGKRWVNRTLDMARDIGAHGIIHFQLIGCTPSASMGSVIADRSKKELGIPTVNFEGRYLDREFTSQEEFDETLSAFIDKCFDWAGKPRQ